MLRARLLHGWSLGYKGPTRSGQEGGHTMEMLWYPCAVYGAGGAGRDGDEWMDMGTHSDPLTSCV